MENIAVEKREQFASIDVLKFIMSVCVIAIHTHALVNYKENLVIKGINMIMWSAVPFFFMTSGFLLYNKIYELNKVEKMKVLWQTIKKTFFSYLLCSFAYLPLSCKAYKGMNLKTAIIRYVFDFIFLGQHRDDWIMWYLLSSIYALVFLYILVRLNISQGQIILSSLIVMMFAFNMDVLSESDNTLLNNNWKFIKNAISATTQSGRVFRGMIFMPAGWIYSMIRNETGGGIGRVYSVILMVISAIGSIIAESQYVTKNIFLSFFSMILFSIAVNLKLKINYKSALCFRIASKVIYFSHMYVFIILSKYIWGEKVFGMKSFALVATATVSLSILWIIFALPSITSIKTG